MGGLAATSGAPLDSGQCKLGLEVRSQLESFDRAGPAPCAAAAGGHQTLLAIINDVSC